MEDLVEFLDDSVLINGKEYRDFWMIPYNVSKKFSPELTDKVIAHLIRHEKFLCDNTNKSVPLEAFYVLLGSHFPIFLN